MPLYGNELDRSTNPFEAGLGRVVRLDKAADFVGRSRARGGRIERGRAPPGRARRSTGRGIVRHGYPIYCPGEADECGVVTSGTMSPTLGIPIAMAYVPSRRGRAGYHLGVVASARRASRVAVRALPFYQRTT